MSQLLRPWPAQCHLIDTSLRGLTLRLVAGSFAKSIPSSIHPAVTGIKFLSATLGAGAIVLTEGLQKLVTAATTSTTKTAFLLGGDLAVNRLAYGAMRLTGKGVWGWPADRENARKVLRRAVELGVNFIDTADAYGSGASELLIAGALPPHPAGLLVATKGGPTLPGANRVVANRPPR